MDISARKNTFPMEENGYAILFRSDYAEADAYFAAIVRCVEQYFDKYRDGYKIVRRGNALAVSNCRRIGGMVTVTDAVADMDSGLLTLEFRFLISRPGDRLPLMKQILEHQQENLRSVKFTVTESGFCRMLAGYSWNVSGAFSEEIFRRTLLHMETVLFLYNLRKIPAQTDVTRLPEHFAQVLGSRPDHAVFRQDKHLILSMLSKENDTVPADRSPYLDDREETDNIWEELEETYGK